jgi:hypothetical protein
MSSVIFHLIRPMNILSRDVLIFLGGGGEKRIYPESAVAVI